MLLVVFFGNKFSYEFQVNFFFGVQAVLMVLLPVCIIVPENVHLKYWLCLTNLFMLSLATGISQGACFGFGGFLPYRFMAAIQLGNGISGILMNVLRSITLTIYPKDTPHELQQGAIIYFACSGLIMLTATSLFPFHKRLELLKYYHKKAKAQEEGLVVKEEANKLWQVFKETIGMSFGLFSVYFCTFLVFPGTSDSTSISFIKSSAWFNVFFVSLFNVFDTIGRTMGGINTFFISVRALYALTFLRYLFVGTFVAIAKNWGPSWIFGQDWFKILNLVLFAFLNGYL